jgi:hypothetical protein
MAMPDNKTDLSKSLHIDEHGVSIDADELDDRLINTLANADLTAAAKAIEMTPEDHSLFDEMMADIDDATEDIDRDLDP